MIVGGQTGARALAIIDHHQLSLTIMRRLTRALDFLKRDFPRCAWSIPTLEVFYLDTNVTVDEIKEAVGNELAGPRPASWLPSIAKKKKKFDKNTS